MRLLLLGILFLPKFISAQVADTTESKNDIIFIFDVYVKDKDTGKPIPNCEVTLIGSDSTQVVKTTDSIGKVSFDKNGEERYIKKETSYSFVATKKDYLPAKGNFSTVGKTASTRFVEDVFLTDTKCRGICCTLPIITFPVVEFSSKSNKLVQIPSINNSKDSLNFMYQILIQNPDIIIEIQGHSDCTEKDYDKKLSQRRAQTCVDYLVSKGIPKERLVAKGYGDENPLFRLDCESISKLPTKVEKEKAHQMNRRVQFIVLGENYKPSDN
jgi:peptidoglycan-associated lipoprotein